MRRRPEERVQKLRGACRPAAKRAIQGILPGSSGAHDLPAQGSTLLSPPESGICVPVSLFLGTPPPDSLAPSLPRSGLLRTSRFCGWFSALLGGSNVLRTATLLACASLGEPVAQSGAHTRLPSVLTLVLPLLLGALPAPDFAHLLLRWSLPGSSRFH